jgi:hypothetical protein
MKQTTADKDDMLHEAFELGLQAQKDGSAEEALKGLQAKYGDDPELASFFQRGLEAPPFESRVHKGRLVSHGPARYKHTQGEKMSYFVTLATDKGLETIWGKDLQRAIKKCDLKAGDHAVLDFRGKTPTRVKSNIRDDAGKVIGTEWITAERSTWKAARWDPSQDHAFSLHTGHPDQRGPSAQNYEIFDSAPTRSIRTSGRVVPAHNSLMGTKGASGLGDMLKTGGQVLQATIATYAFDRASREFETAMLDVNSELAAFGQGELSSLMREDLTENERQGIVSKFLESPVNRADYELLLAKLDNAQSLSSKLITKGIDKGLSADDILDRAISPLHRMLSDHEKLLKGLDEGHGSLYDQISDAVSGLFSHLRDLFKRAVEFMTGQHSAPSSTARMNS